MPIIKSAKKRVKLTRKATARNLHTKRAVKKAVRELQTALSSKNAGKVATSFSTAQSALDRAGKKNLMHRNKVARKQRQLAKLAKAAGIKPTASAKKAAKPAAKAPTKKPAAKKPAAKKATKK